MESSKYQHGKIYILKSKQTERFYIGSTIAPLIIRLRKHKCDLKRYEVGKSKKYMTSNEILKFEDVEIKILYEFPCSSKKILEREEGRCIIRHRIDFPNLCVNNMTPGQTDKEYYEKRKLDPEFLINRRLYNKKYRKENKGTIKERRGPTINCPCGGTYDKYCKKVHEKSKKHLFFLEHGKKSEDVKMHSIDCECGGSYMGRYKNHINYYYKNHLKTILHQTYLNNSN